MKSILNILLLICSFFLAAGTANIIYAQKMAIVSPYESLSVKNVTAIGNKKTGTLIISMEFQNNYSKDSKIHFALGGYSDLGFETDKGKKFKIYTSEHLIGTQNINKGYLPISEVHFGDKKMGSFTYVEQEVNKGEKKTLKVIVNNFDKSSKLITEFHIRCILFLGLMHSGDKIVEIQNINILWQ